MTLPSPVNNLIDTQLATQEEAVANGEEVSTDFLLEVAKTATVALTQLAEQIEKVASGEIDATSLKEGFSEEALSELVAAVEVPAAAAIAEAAMSEEEELSNPARTTPPTTPKTPTTPDTLTLPAEEDGGGPLAGPQSVEGSAVSLPSPTPSCRRRRGRWTPTALGRGWPSPCNVLSRRA